MSKKKAQPITRSSSSSLLFGCVLQGDHKFSSLHLCTPFINSMILLSESITFREPFLRQTNFVMSTPLY